MSKDILVVSETLTGSKLYKTDFVNSDKDLITVFAYTIDQLLRGDTPAVFRSKDTVYYEFDKFIRLLLQGDITCHEVLWIEETEAIRSQATVFRILKNRKKEFIDKRVLQTWLATSEVLVNQARKLGIIEKQKKTVKDFLSVLTVHPIYGASTFPFTELLTTGNFDPHCTITKKLDLKSYGIDTADAMAGTFNIWQDYLNSEGSSQLSGIINEKTDELIVDTGLGTLSKTSYHRYTFKGVLIYDRRGHLRYKESQRRVKDAKMVREYAPKSMYHGFRILYSLMHFLKYKRLPLEAPNSHFLMDIRKGNYTLDYILGRYRTELQEVTNLLEQEKEIPNEVNYEVLVNIIRRVKEDIREKNSILIQMP